MSAAEFGEWQVMYQAEELHPGVERQRHAQQLAAAFNGPAQRRDKRHWAAADFLPAPAWQPAPKPTTGAQVRAHVQAMNARRIRH